MINFVIVVAIRLIVNLLSSNNENKNKLYLCMYVWIVVLYANKNSQMTNKKKYLPFHLNYKLILQNMT